MKTVEHVTGLTVCLHTGDSWRVALSKTASCLQVGFSAAEEQLMVQEMAKGGAVWHRGNLLTGRTR